jgi:hypothetical protein
MPDQEESTAPPEQPASPAAVSPPAIDPEKWEDFPTFRETFLRWFTKPEANVAMRAFGLLLHEMMLEWNGSQPDEPGGYIRHDLRAALADLRHVEGFLGYIHGELEDLDEDNPDDADPIQLCEFAGDMARRLARVAAAIEKALG